jgi:hypothetical protein
VGNGIRFWHLALTHSMLLYIFPRYFLPMTYDVCVPSHLRSKPHSRRTQRPVLATPHNVLPAQSRYNPLMCLLGQGSRVFLRVKRDWCIYQSLVSVNTMPCRTATRKRVRHGPLARRNANACKRKKENKQRELIKWTYFLQRRYRASQALVPVGEWGGC